MKPVEVFILRHCPYCHKAKTAWDELKKEDAVYARVPVKWINEEEERDYAMEHDYYYVPTIYYDRRKVFEAHPGDSYEKIRDAVKLALDKAVFEGPDPQGNQNEG